MNFSVAAVMVAAVAACNGRDPRAAPATARPIATHGAAPVVMPPPPAAVRDAHRPVRAGWRRPRRARRMTTIFPGRDACEDEPALWLVW